MPLAQTPADPSQWSSPLQAPVDSGACCSSAHLAETPTCCLAVSSGPGQLHVVRAWHLTPAVSGVGSSQAALQASQFFFEPCAVRCCTNVSCAGGHANLLFPQKYWYTCLEKKCPKQRSGNSTSLSNKTVLNKLPQAEVRRQQFP